MAADIIDLGTGYGAIELQEQSRGAANYGSEIRAVFRALWLELITYDAFFSSMMVAIQRGLTLAWEDGAKECGIKSDEFTAAERMELEQFIYDQYSYISGVAEYIEANSKPKGGNWAAMVNRSNLWANKWREVRARAASIACANKKKQFVLGATKEHCKSCLGLNGRVYRYETWAANGAIPPSGAFECQGFQCLCYLVDTDQRVTPGRFPRSLLINA
ncbi:MAG: hypothetical protein PVJ86_02790 [Phycisphaerales bacterium]|jgi:hypothetical protein